MYSRVYVEITNICNMNCSFCHGHSRAPKKMTKSEFSRILSELKGKTNYIYYHLMGEPLMHSELTDFINMATEQGFKSMITTNGTLLDKHGDALILSGLHKVNISLHSFESNDNTNFNKYLSEISSFAKKASDSGIITVIRLWNRGLDGGRNDIALKFLQKEFSDEWNENSRGLKLRDKLFVEFGERFEWPDSSAYDFGYDVACHGMRDHFGILCDGTVVPCCLDSDGVIALGNIYKQSLSDILNTERAQNIKRGFECRRASEELCRRCGYARRF